jgi:catechol 2,3-dioxygenase-like lactoylglutathione lyase family enzyme
MTTRHNRAISEKHLSASLFRVLHMITNVSLATVWVDNQDEARDFYVDKLGFELRDDLTIGPGFRWLTVGHPGQPELMLTLMVPGPPLDPEAAEDVRRLVAKGALGSVGLAVDDCHKTYKELSAKGVEFIQEPADRPYGVEAIIRDNSGNWIVLVDRRDYTAADFKPE